MNTTYGRRILAAALAGALLLPAAARAVSLAVTPPGITNEYAGSLTFDVAGLTAGATVRIESVVDLDGDGSADAGEPLVQSVTVTDGVAPSIAGVRMTSVPGDEDGAADGAIRSVLTYRNLVEGMRASATYLHCVSGVTPTFAPVTTAYTVGAPVYPQRVEGTVSAGAPVPRAFVYLISQDTGDPVSIAVADAAGHYELPAPAGSYAVAATKDGFLFSQPPSVTVGAGAVVTQDLTLIPADRTISGSLVDDETGDGIPGVQLYAANSPNPEQDGDPFGISFTDASGHISFPVVSGTSWRIEPSERAAALGGWVSPDSYPAIDATGEDVVGGAIRWRRGTAVIHGTVTDGAGPVAGIFVYGSIPGFKAVAASDADGRYQCPALAGTWSLGLDSDQLGALGYFAQGQQVSLMDGEAKVADFLLTSATAHVQGKMRDPAGTPIAGAYVIACQQLGGGQGPCTSAQTAQDGTYDVGVAAGNWMLSGETEDLTNRGLVGPHVPRTVADGATVTGVDIVVRSVNTHLVGDVRDATGAAVPGLFTWVSRLVGGTEYGAGAQTAGDGSFSVGLFGGTWQASLDCGDLTRRGFICPSNQSVVMTVGIDQTLHWVLHGLPCSGDCNGDGSVTAPEIDASVQIALGLAASDSCSTADANADGKITVEDLVTGVLRSRAGCRPA